MDCRTLLIEIFDTLLFKDYWRHSSAHDTKESLQTKMCRNYESRFSTLELTAKTSAFIYLFI